MEAAVQEMPRKVRKGRRKRTAAATREGSFETELWMDQRLDLGEFQTALEERFGFMRVEVKTVIENADPVGHPDHRYLQVITPLSRKDEVIPFFDEWAAAHHADHVTSPRSTYPTEHH